jgi:uncharacterized membrane protein
LTLFNIGKYVFATVFLVFGALHFMNADAMAGMVPASVPGGVMWVYLTGLAHIAFAVAIYTGRYAKLACQLMALMLIIFVALIHLPAAMGGDMAAPGNVLKDLGLAAGALILGNNYQEGPGL